MKRDGNEARIVAHLRKLGFVVVLHDPGSRRGSEGEPDAFVFSDICVPVEFKMPGNDLNDAQEEFHAKVAAVGGMKIAVVTNEVEAEIAMGLTP